MLFGVKKFKRMNKLTMMLKKNRIEDICIDMLFRNLLKVKILRKLELNLSINQIKDKGA